MSKQPEPRVLPLDEIDELESLSSDLGPAYDALLQRWRAGLQDRETSLRLLFLAWYGVVEPSDLTGLPEGTSPVAREVFDHLQAIASDDPEFLLVGAHMTHWPYAFAVAASEQRDWESRGRSCRSKAARLGVSGLPPEHFAGRGVYETYFAHIASVGGLRSS